MNSKRKREWATSQLTKGWAVIALLFLYLLGSANVESCHSFFHRHEASVIHTEQNETDPCHITLYHQERDGGCHHDSHFVNEEKCSLCHVQLYNAQVEEVGAITLLDTFCVVSFSDCLELYIAVINFESPGRAPPVG